MQKHVKRSIIAAVLIGVAAFAAVGITGCCKSKPKAKFNEACENNLDCESLVCAEEAKICSKQCQYDPDCGGDLVCRGDDTGTGSHCSKKIGTATSGSCMTADQCDHGHCLKRVGKEDEPGICSQHCKAPEDCPAGFKTCMSISDSGAVKFCLPGEEKFGAAPAKPKGAATTPVPTTKKSATPTPSASAPPATSGSAKPPASSSAPPASSAKPPIKKIPDVKKK